MKRNHIAPTPGTYKGTCPKCNKEFTVSEKKIMLGGSPPEFPILIRGHCGLIVDMSMVTKKETKKK